MPDALVALATGANDVFLGSTQDDLIVAVGGMGSASVRIGPWGGTSPSASQAPLSVSASGAAFVGRLALWPGGNLTTTTASAHLPALVATNPSTSSAASVGLCLSNSAHGAALWFDGIGAGSPSLTRLCAATNSALALRADAGTFVSCNLTAYGASVLSNGLVVYGGGTTSLSNVVNLSKDLNVMGASVLSNGMSLSGNAIVAGTSYVSGTGTFSNGLAVSGNAVVAGTSYVSGFASFSNVVNLSKDLNVMGASVLSNGLSLSGNAIVAGTSYVSGTGTFSNGLAVFGNAIVAGTSYVSGFASFSNVVNLSKDLNVMGASVLSNGLSLSGNAIVAGTSYVSGTGTFSNGLAVFGNAIVAGTSYVSGVASFSNVVNLSKDLNVMGASVLSNGLSLSGNAIVAGTSYVSGTGTFSNGLAVSGNAIVAGTSYVSGFASFSNVVNLSKDLNVMGASVLSNGLTVYGGATTVNNNLSVTGTFSVNKALIVTSSSATNVQGTWLTWNRDGSSGKSYFINQYGNGGGGLSFGKSTTGDAYTELMALSSSGALSGLTSVTASSFSGGLTGNAATSSSCTGNALTSSSCTGNALTSSSCTGNALTSSSCTGNASTSSSCTGNASTSSSCTGNALTSSSCSGNAVTSSSCSGNAVTSSSCSGNAVTSSSCSGNAASANFASSSASANYATSSGTSSSCSGNASTSSTSSSCTGNAASANYATYAESANYATSSGSCTNALTSLNANYATWSGSCSGNAETSSSCSGNAATASGLMAGSTVTASNIVLRRSHINFALGGDGNHLLYNNVGNNDGEGVFDGIKWNSLSGFRLRSGEGGRTSALTINLAGTVTVGDNSEKNKILVLWDGDVDENAGSGVKFFGFGINTSTLRYQVDNAASSHKWYSGSSNTMTLNGVGNLTVSGSIYCSGNVGIGTESPVCPLEITTDRVIAISNYGYLSQNGTIGYITGTNNGHVSLKVAGRIWCGGEIDVTSDRRIKHDIDAIRTGLALDDLMRMVPVNYSHIDKPAHGRDRRTVGFIAQEVEAVWPDSVSKTSDFIPDIMAFGLVIERVNDTTIIVEFQSDDPIRVLDIGDKLKLIGDDKMHTGYVTLVDGSRKFTIVVSEAFRGSSSNIFVYGKEVDDFRVLNYDYIMTQNVAATQALYRKLVELQDRVSNQNVLNLSLQSRLASLEEHVSKLL